MKNKFSRLNYVILTVKIYCHLAHIMNRLIEEIFHG